MVWIESGVRLLRLLQAACEEARADQEHEREGDLSHHEATREARLVQSSGDAARFLLQTVCTGRLEERSAGRIPKMSAARMETAIVARSTR